MNPSTDTADMSVSAIWKAAFFPVPLITNFLEYQMVLLVEGKTASASALCFPDKVLWLTLEPTVSCDMSGHQTNSTSYWVFATPVKHLA